MALFWNTRRTNTTAFLRAYEYLLQRYGTDYRQVSFKKSDAEIEQLLGYQCPPRVFANEQFFDFTDLRGRLLSSSYTPARDHPNYVPTCVELERMFEAD